MLPAKPKLVLDNISWTDTEVNMDAAAYPNAKLYMSAASLADAYSALEGTVAVMTRKPPKDFLRKNGARVLACEGGAVVAEND